jgi:hypothetical protein
MTMGPVGRLHKTWESLEEKHPKISESTNQLTKLIKS